MSIDREQLGRLVRELWISWAIQQPDPKQSWLVPYDDLSEADREADRVIGEGLMHEFFAATTGERLRVQRALQVLRGLTQYKLEIYGDIAPEMIADSNGGWVDVDAVQRAVQILEGEN